MLDQLLDHVSSGKDGGGVYNPKNVRQAMMPLRRVAGERGIAAVGLLHPVKGRPKTFRDLLSGSHQFNAVSRSSLLLGKDPDDEDRRVLVRGKGNHSAAPRSFEFRVGVESFDLAGHRFEMPVVTDVEEGDRSVEDLLVPPKDPVAGPLAEELADLLTDEPQALVGRQGRGPEAAGRLGPKRAEEAQGAEGRHQDLEGMDPVKVEVLPQGGLRVPGANPLRGCTCTPPESCHGQGADRVQVADETGGATPEGVLTTHVGHRPLGGYSSCANHPP